MPNLDFSVEQADTPGGNIKQVRAAFSAYPAKLRTVLDRILDDAIEEGYRVALEEAPTNKSDPAKNRGRTIRDAIRVSGIDVRRGGVGGGASVEKRLIADGFIAPHLRYVLEGTGRKQGAAQIIEARRRFATTQARIEALTRGERMTEPRVVGGNLEIKASETTRNRRGFLIEKMGEEPHFVSAISGQRPQDEWWINAREAINARMRESTERFRRALADVSFE